MNPLEKLKQKLMVKPTIDEFKPVVVAIKGEIKEPQKEVKGRERRR